MKSLTILLVDDDSLVRVSTAMMIEDMGHIVREASSALQALTLLDEHEFDILVTYYAMPGMTGAELIALFRKTRPELPYALATGHADLPSDCAPISVKIHKPFTGQGLAEAINKAMAAKRQ